MWNFLKRLFGGKQKIENINLGKRGAVPDIGAFERVRTKSQLRLPVPVV
jgi:hypothetical protein